MPRKCRLAISWKHVDIARDQVGFRGDAQPQPGGRGENFENRTGDAIAPLGGLIRIGGGAQRDRFAARQLAQFVAKRGRVETFGVDFALELKRIAQLHELVRVAGVAILAPELAAAIGVDGPAERDARAVAARQKRARLQLEIFDAPLGFDSGTCGGEFGDAHEIRHATIFAVYSPAVKTCRSVKNCKSSTYARPFDRRPTYTR